MKQILLVAIIALGTANATLNEVEYSKRLEACLWSMPKDTPPIRQTLESLDVEQRCLNAFLKEVVDFIRQEKADMEKKGKYDWKALDYYNTKLYHIQALMRHNSRTYFILKRYDNSNP